MRVDRAAAKRGTDAVAGGVDYDRTKSIFVGNLPFNVEVSAPVIQRSISRLALL